MNKQELTQLKILLKKYKNNLLEPDESLEDAQTNYGIGLLTETIDTLITENWGSC